jgi:hypothetical protein
MHLFRQMQQQCHVKILAWRHCQVLPKAVTPHSTNPTTPPLLTLRLKSQNNANTRSVLPIYLTPSRSQPTASTSLRSSRARCGSLPPAAPRAVLAAALLQHGVVGGVCMRLGRCKLQPLHLRSTASHSTQLSSPAWQVSGGPAPIASFA